MLCSERSLRLMQTQDLYYMSHESGCVRPADYYRQSLKAGDVVAIRCTSTCEHVRHGVHGENPYTMDSSPCVAAFRNGLLKEAGGVIHIKYAGYRTIYRKQVGSSLMQVRPNTPPASSKRFAI
jgi:hypothetical protein